MTRQRTMAGSPGQSRRVLAATVLGSSMAFIDGSVVNVALPAIQADLQAGVGAMQWVVNAYLLLLGALVLLGGALGDRAGRVRVFMAGIAVFAAASLGCALAPSAAALVAARAVQGLGAALLVPSSLAIIGAAFNEADRGAAIGTWSAAGALTTALGPVLGGWLVDAVSWRAIFLLNVPIAAAALWLARGLIESRDAEAAPGGLDWVGSGLAVAGLGLLAYGLIEAPARGLGSLSVLGTVGTGLALLAAFVLAEARVRAPMVPLGVFRSRAFSGANAVTLLLYFGLSGVLVFLPYTLIEGHGYSATAAGAALLPLSLLLGVGSRAAGRAAARVGARAMLVAGPVLAGVGFALLGALAGQASYRFGVLPGMLVLGVGMTVAVAPLTTAVMAAVPAAHAGSASGINNAVARVAGLLAVAVLGLLFLKARGQAIDAGQAGALIAGFRVVAFGAAACAIGAAAVAMLTIAGPQGPTGNRVSSR